MNAMTRQLTLWFLGACAIALGACASSSASQCEATGILCPSGMHCAAAEPICISDLNLCGNAHPDPGEVCDDGNNRDGDGCSADCKSDETCGNGRVDTTVGEVCDTPLAKDANGKFTCSADCKSNEKCGNGILDKEAGEVCDDGNQVDGDGCSADCTSDERCGNGKVDRAKGEICDDGNTDNGDSCSSDCKFGAGCGNGIIDVDKDGHPIEECDDGNKNNSDDCRNDCVVNRCGDGVLDSDGVHKEECDAAAPQSGGSRTVTPTESAECNSDCTKPHCGDGKVNHSFVTPDGPEQCDDGPENDEHKDCTNNCQVNRCGDGHSNTLGILHSEACDDGNKIDSDGCSNACTLPHCGNGIVDQNEECDDGNTDDNDDCRSDCVVNRCGDGVRNMHGAHPEDCDAATPQRNGSQIVNPTESATCNSDCTTASCGDGKLNRLFVTPDGPEQCDTGLASNANSADCTTNCQINVCGDNHRNTTAGHSEDCDDGNRIDTDGCTNACKLSACGDGIVGPNENCDDGTDPVTGNRNKPGARCNANCKFNVCGDGDKNPSEQCDGGNGSPRDTSTCNADCTLPVCGDGHTNTQAQEVCDDGPANGTLASTCSSSCQRITCGNGIREQNEACDSGVAGTKTDSATCDDDCTLPVCGDGHTNTLTGEVCDDGVLNGTLASPNHCSATCQKVKCGNGVIEQGEQCDDGTDPDPLIGNRNKAGARCNASCQINVCGDHDVLAGVEQCDSGAVDTSDCDADCTKPVCGDQHTNLAAHETCDNGATNGTAADPCDLFCHSRACGNGFLDVGEECDPGAVGINTATCNSDCTISRCGDGKINAQAIPKEICDDGPTNGDACDYNQPGCMRCNSTCTGTVQPGGPFCGDGIPQATFNETCDNGGGLTPFDTMTCDSDCTPVACGDRHTNSKTEGCDDGNNDDCGGCKMGCQISVIPATAVGSITAAASLANGGNIADGDNFTLNDGLHPAITFEFDVASDGTVAAGHVVIKLKGDGSEDAGAVAAKMITAITAQSSLDFTVATLGSNGEIVQLTNKNKSSKGNTTIGHASTHNDTINASFTFTNFAGGASGDCPAGTGCKDNSDCTSNSCDPTTHLCH